MKREHTEKQDVKRTGTDQGAAGDSAELNDSDLDAIVGGIASFPNRVSPPVTHLNSLDGVV